MSARETVAALFFALVDDPTEAGFAALTRLHPAPSEAVLAYLRGRHVDGVAPVEAWETSAALAPVLSLILATGGASAGQGLVALALATRDPRQLRALGELVLGVVTPDDLARSLIDALPPGVPDAIRSNASELVYHTYDAAGEDYAASPELHGRLAAALVMPAAA